MFSEHELAYLKGSPILAKIQAKIDLWQKDYDLLCQANPAVKDIVSFKEFKEGKIIANIRGYDI